MDRVGTPEILARTADELSDWRRLAQPLTARFRAEDDVAGAAFVAAIAQAAAAAGHAVPEIRLGRGLVDVALFSVDETGDRCVTAKDLELALVITGIAQSFELSSLPGEAARVELALDTADLAVTGPFWAALLTGDAGHLTGDTVFDPSDRVPAVWFQRRDAQPEPRQRWHLDLWLAPEVADARIAAAVAAGGTLIDDAQAPAFTVLADPEGNKVCVCTAVGRA
ncbi:4a-hydroxytetrahydrobiopterin dehydratase [Streptomyces sp. NBC_00178]|uniref:VOC family protein n=1 Tax=Streptomyces sp. NBC_00178 TaxID=2975672 RepID=UPI002E2ADA8E|nr:VOC family protein [Streptomyces sp. NBC_00178]